MASRMFESNGPDVKLRGTTSHICKRYQMLARDAQSQGDRVRAENYLQHAEHYYRMALSFQRQGASAGGAGAPPPRAAEPPQHEMEQPEAHAANGNFAPEGFKEREQPPLAKEEASQENSEN